MSIIVARWQPTGLPLTSDPLADLPEGWSVWEPGVLTFGDGAEHRGVHHWSRHYWRRPDGTIEMTVDRWPPPEEHVMLRQGEPGFWYRHPSAQELQARFEEAVQAWMASREGAFELVDSLPPRLRAQALHRLGYGATAGGVHVQSDRLALRDLVSRGGRSDQREPVDDPHGTPGAYYSGDSALTWEPEPDQFFLSFRHPGGYYAEITVRSMDRALIRAESGTPLPDGWEELGEDDLSVWERYRGWSLAYRAPTPFSHEQATARTRKYAYVPTELIYVVVRPEPDGRWSYTLGLGGHAVTRGVRDTQEQARHAGLVAMGTEQGFARDFARERCGGRLDWVGWGETPPEPYVVVCERGESARDALLRMTNPHTDSPGRGRKGMK